MAADRYVCVLIDMCVFLRGIATYVCRWCVFRVSVHRGIGEVVFPRRVVFAGRLFHNSTIVRRHLSQPQLARSAYVTSAAINYCRLVSYINILSVIHYSIQFRRLNFQLVQNLLMPAILRIYLLINMRICILVYLVLLMRWIPLQRKLIQILALLI